MATDLLPRESAFADAYEGNGVDACRKAGYAGNEATLAVQASRLLRKPKVRERIEARRTKKSNAIIASREERQEFWTKVMKDADGSMYDRLKASELLGKSDGDFLTRLSDPDGEALKVCVVVLGDDE